MQRTLGTILLAVLVIFAGCGGVLGGGGDEPKVTFTPMQVPTDKPTPTPVPQLAPGLTGKGIENSYALVAAHRSFLRNRSFTTRSNTTALAPNGSILFWSMDTLRAEPVGEGFHFVSEWNGSYGNSDDVAIPIRTEVWSNGEQVVLKQMYANGTATYERLSSDAKGQRNIFVLGSLSSLLEPRGINDTAVTKRFTRNGTTLYRVQGTSQSDVWGNVTFQLIVDSRGVIHEYTRIRWLPSEENISKIVSTTRFSKIGATDVPERPSWVDEAMNRTTPIAGETTTTNR